MWRSFYLMAFIHVAFVENPAHACRYLIACSIMGSSYTLVMDYPEPGQFIMMVTTFLFFTLGFIGTLHSPLYFESPSC